MTETKPPLSIRLQQLTASTPTDRELLPSNFLPVKGSRRMTGQACPSSSWLSSGQPAKAAELVDARHLNITATTAVEVTLAIMSDARSDRGGERGDRPTASETTARDDEASPPPNKVPNDGVSRVCPPFIIAHVGAWAAVVPGHPPYPNQLADLEGYAIHSLLPFPGPNAPSRLHV